MSPSRTESINRSLPRSTIDELSKRLSGHELEHQEAGLVDLLDVEDLRDVLVVQAPQRASRSLEATQPLLVAGQLRRNDAP